MILRSSCIIIALLFSSVCLSQDRVLRNADKTITKFYDVAAFEKETIIISEDNNAQTASEFANDNFFRIHSNDQFLGYGYIGNAPSKASTFDYLILFDSDFIITKSKVLIYREEYGGEISSKRWLKQFIGKTPNSQELYYNRDIIPISGATISVQAMTKAMNDLLKSISYLQKSNRI